MDKRKDKPTKSKTEPKCITTAEFDAMFDAGEDISDYLDLESMRVLGPGEEYLDLPPKAPVL
jgi:hypothetical protein